MRVLLDQVDDVVYAITDYKPGVGRVNVVLGQRMTGHVCLGRVQVVRVRGMQQVVGMFDVVRSKDAAEIRAGSLGSGR